MGFFDLKQTSSDKVVGRSQTCASCGLYKNSEHPKMEPSGGFQKEILIIGGAPTVIEDKKGRIWGDAAGVFLKNTLREYGFSLEEHVLSAYAVQCIPLNENGQHRSPNSHEILCCRSKVQTIIKQHKPKVIILLGMAAVESVIGKEWKESLGSLAKWRGWTIPDKNLQAWVCPTYHPADVLQDELQVETAFKADLKKALSMVKVPFPEEMDAEKRVTILNTRQEIRATLEGIMAGHIWPDPSLVAFDYETTGISPYDITKHKIICASICPNEFQSYAFMMPYKSKSCMRLWKESMETDRFGKMAHNLKFEQTWTTTILGYPVKNWKWDSLLASHILDNREGATGLKFQVYTRLGISDYASEIRPFLQSGSKNSNAVNNIEELVKTEVGKQKLLMYCGLDSLYEFRLAVRQMEEVGE